MLNNPFWRKHVITQYFWKNPQMYHQFGWKWHNGIDFRCNKHIVFATHEGICRVVRSTAGYGNHVYIIRMSHDWGYETIYGHLSDIFVKDGQKVTTRTAIGKSGNTGNSTGPHLHFWLRFLNSNMTQRDKWNGYDGYIDPLPYFLAWKI